MTDLPLIATKLAFPRLADDLLRRPRLLERLEDGLRAHHPFFLLSAPAGAGKSTLLATWLESRREKVVWLSLDSADNDPIRFMRYLATALWRRHGEGVWPESTSVYTPGRTESMESVLSRLLQGVAALEDELIVVLDDYHLISNAEVKQAIAFLLEVLPQNARLVISTRADPQLPVARLRARGLLTEIRGQDLSFTRGEAEEYLNALAGLHLEEDEVRHLAARTEGWIVGVRLAALALRGTTEFPDRRRRLVAGFSGRHHFVLDYLVEEVLSGLEREERSLLLHTSPLNRFSASLADELSPLGGWGPSEPILTGVLRKNIFIIPLDDERNWYRYHHLFADLLRGRLRSENPEREQQIHGRAATWFLSHGLVEEAIEHALAGAHWEMAGELLAEHAHALLERGEMLTVMGWLERLPREVARNSPRIALELAWALTFGNRLEEAELLLGLVEEGFETTEPEGAATQPVSREVSGLEVGRILLRGYLALASDRPQETVDLLRAFEKLPGARQPERGIADWLRGYAYRALGDMETALEHARRSVVEAGAAGRLWQMLTLNDLAIAHFVRAELGAALEQYSLALALGDEHGHATHGYLGRVQTGLAQVYFVRQELDRALEHATLAVEWSERWNTANHLVYALAMLARVRVARNELGEARTCLDRAELERRSARLLPTVSVQLELAWVEYWLAAGNLERAETWSESMLDDRAEELLRASTISDADVLRLQALIRVRLASPQARGSEEERRSLEETAAWARRAETLVSRAGWRSYLPGMVAAQALAAHRLGNPDALPLVRRALELAAPAGLVRSFAEWGPDMQSLLGELLPKKLSESDTAATVRLSDRGSGGSPEFLPKVLAAFVSANRPFPKGSAPWAPTVPTRPGEPEALTPREAEVLSLLDQGLSNKAIARRLFVSAGTVKTHTHRLYRKLGVQSRTAALARAREFGLL